VLTGPENIQYRSDLPDPRIEVETDAIVAVRLAGICGSDLHPYHGREPVSWGVIPGHEAAGEVVNVGARVRRFAPPDRVFLPFTTSCDACVPCLQGLSSRCERGRLFGWGPPGATPDRLLHGTQAELVRVPLADTTLLTLPDDLGFEDGVLLGDNFTTGYYCAKRGGNIEGQLVAIVGCGAVGRSALVSARHMGASRIIAVDPVPARRESALRLGADVAAAPGDALVSIVGLVGHDVRGASVVLEAVGSLAARQLAISLAAPGATVSSVGVATEDFGFTPADVYDRNLTLRSGRCPVRSLMPELMDALRGGQLRMPTSELVSATPVLLQDGPAAYRAFAARSGPGSKPLLAP
jgi:threonine dehydrogenase-like Zn-dependent dehydrogenase